MATSKVENSAQVFSCQLKFVHGHWDPLQLSGKTRENKRKNKKIMGSIPSPGKLKNL
jgi:hypothetical protein